MDEIKFYRAEDEWGCFSNFAPYPINLNGKEWKTTEHYFQAQKFVGTKYEDMIRFADSPGDAFRIANNLKEHIRKDWEEVKDNIMREAIYAKFTQHQYLRKILIGTGDTILIEHTKSDDYWGDGGDGTGKNMLGKILMEIREKLKDEDE